MKCTGEKKARTVGDNETFVSLMQSPFNRRSMRNTLVAEMKLKSAPIEFIRAVASLLDDSA
jgi:hypothetical protein